MTTEKELRETLSMYGCGLEIHEFSKHDRISAYPTKLKGIHKMELNLRDHLDTCPLADILKHLLSKKDFEEWVLISTPIKGIATGALE
jgi:hypothetical protein